MQDRYAGDIGDYVKLALLRQLSGSRTLGISWYLYPDEDHNSDGRHVGYLGDPQKWRHLDHELFDALAVVATKGRSVAALQSSGVLRAKFHDQPLISAALPASVRPDWRRKWFTGMITTLADCDLVFADPDNGIVDDQPHRYRHKTFGKQMPLAEAKMLAAERPAIIYHHNTRFKGGHDAEVRHWLEQLEVPSFAVRSTAYSCRTFFVLNFDQELLERARDFCGTWRSHGVRLDEPLSASGG